jgi:hypothetical protein
MIDDFVFQSSIINHQSSINGDAPMTRSAARRTSAVQAEKSSLPAPSAASSSEMREPLPAPAVAWYWRLALFLWLTSFAFLFLYEWLAAILKAVRK